MTRGRDFGGEGTRLVTVPIDGANLEGDLVIPDGARAVVLFAHGSGSSRKSPRNRYVAGVLNESGLATLLIDLLTADEEVVDMQTARLRFDIELLAHRLLAATAWLTKSSETRDLKIGYFGASTGAAAALVAAATGFSEIYAVVSRGGRPDLAEETLPEVKAPTLLIVGGKDYQVIQMNIEALEYLRSEKALEIVQGATHLFEEPGTLEEVARLAADWFVSHLDRAQVS